jgi:flavin reductase (DIM6/NTAB) family NADH-FMN oxidoreductase RutF
MNGRSQAALVTHQSTTKKSLPLRYVYQYIEPGPVVLMTTTHRQRFNVMTQSWHTMLEFQPALIGCVVSDENYSFSALVRTRECVLSLPTIELSAAVVGCGNSSGRTLDKFSAFSLTPVAGKCVAAPCIDECHADFECRVIDTRFKSRYNFFVMQVVAAWVRSPHQALRTLHHLGRGSFMVGGRPFNLPSKAR